MIEWTTVVAQIVNFIILVWLLKRFLYRPILDAMGKREAKIAANLKEAAEQSALAEKEREEFQQKNATFAEQKVSMLAQASDEVEQKRKAMIEDARAEVWKLQTQWQNALANEKDAFRSELVERVQAETLALARKTLDDLAGVALEERMADVFAQRLGELDAAERARIAESLTDQDTPVAVRCAFELPEVQREAVAKAVREKLGIEFPLDFKTDPNLICGIELVTNEEKVSWTIAHYLDALEKNVMRSFDNTQKPAESAADVRETKEALGQVQTQDNTAPGKEPPADDRGE